MDDFREFLYFFIKISSVFLSMSPVSRILFLPSVIFKTHDASFPFRFVFLSGLMILNIYAIPIPLSAMTGCCTVKIVWNAC